MATIKNKQLTNKEKSLFLGNFVHTHPIDFGKSYQRVYNSTSKKLPKYKWVRTDSTKGVGFVHVYRLKDFIVVRSDRYYSKSLSLVTYKEFDEWRKEINNLRGQ